MKRSPLRRLSDKKARAASGPVRSTLTPSGKPIKKVNPEKRAKRKQRQAAKHRAYMRSQTRKDVDYRANGQCEAAIRKGSLMFWLMLPDFLGVVSPTSWFLIHPIDEEWQRCENRSHLQHHHITYARYGGNELPEDIAVLCKRCHEFLEGTQHPTRRAARRPVSEN